MAKSDFQASLWLFCLLRCVIPWIFCFIISSALHWTYEADLSRLQAKQEAVPDVDDEEEELWLLQPPFWTGGSP